MLTTACLGQAKARNDGVVANKITDDRHGLVRKPSNARSRTVFCPEL